VSTPHAIEIPAATLEALRGYAAVRHSAGAPADTGALLRKEEPLSPADRRALLDALQWWQGQRALADARIREITARLTLTREP
jgi:hypothetical protein